jgi:hypothetical protein
VTAIVADQKTISTKLRIISFSPLVIHVDNYQLSSMNELRIAPHQEHCYREKPEILAIAISRASCKTHKYVIPAKAEIHRIKHLQIKKMDSG